MDKVTVSGTFANAFVCEKCPQTNSAQGCPMWWELITTDIGTAKESLRQGCGFVLMPTLLVETIKASNRPAAEMGALRGELVTAAQKMFRAISQHSLASERALHYDSAAQK